MTTAEAAELYKFDIDGWYVNAADAPMTPYAGEDDPQKTVAFFGDLLNASAGS